MGLIKDNDAISRAMLGGLTSTFKAELKARFMKEAEDMIEPIVENICKRMELLIHDHKLFSDQSRTIRLEWLLKKEYKKCD